MSEELQAATTEVTEATKEITAEVKDSSLEEQARKEGWAPLEEFEGNKDNWVDAKEYLRVSKIIKGRDEKNSKLEKELKELKNITKSLLSNMQKAEQAAYEKASRDLEAKFLRAKEIGDVEEALDIRQQQQALEREAQQTVQQAQSSFKDSQEFQNFLPKNNWVVATDRVSKAMQKVASEMSIEFAKANPRCTWEEELNYIHAEIRKEFPDQFKHEKETKTPTAPVAGASSLGKDGSKDSLEANLRPQEKQMVEYLKQKGYDYKSYLKALNIK